jgi:hypothetical protein
MGNNYTVFLSEPAFMPASLNTEATRLQFLKRLQQTLDDAQDRQWIRSPNTDVRFQRCKGRAPDIDGQEFEPSLVESMYNQRVLLEIWGEFDAERTGGQEPSLKAQINFLLVPIQFAANLNERAPAGMHRLTYPEPSAKPTDDFVQLIARPKDIDAFVAAAFGFKLLREANFLPAHQNLCRANTLLQSIEKRPLAPRSKESVTGLRTFVLESAKRALARVREQSPGQVGILALQSADQPCATEE